MINLTGNGVESGRMENPEIGNLEPELEPEPEPE